MNDPAPDVSASWRERLKEELESLAALAADLRTVRLAQLAAESPALAAEVASLLGHLDPPALPAALSRVLPQNRPSQLGPWRLLGELGHGGMGVVYLAERADGAYVGQAAVKLLPPLLATGARRARFLRECQALARLSHPRIARLIDAGSSEDGFAYIVMEHVDGVPIDVWCRAHRPDLRTLLQLLHSLCTALSYMHARLVVHRDLKPANILVDTDGRVKLLDFGVARLLDETDSSPPTLAEPALTPAYASPEQISGAPISTASDVFSLGSVMYTLLTGRQPFAREGDGALAVLEAVLQREPTPPSQCVPLPADIEAIVLRALEKKPEHRYRSIDAMADDLRRFLDGYPVSARRPTPMYRFGKWVRRHRWQAAAATAAVLAVLGFAVRAELAARAALAQSALAERRLAEVRELAHAVIYDYDRALARLPGTLEVRRAIVDDAIGYLDALAADAGTRPDLMTEVAAAYEHIGSLQGQGWYGPNLGDLEAADQSLRKAEALRRALLASAAADDTAPLALAAVHEKRSDLALTQGRLQAAAELLGEAEALLARLRSAGGQLAAARVALKRGDLAERDEGDGLARSLAFYERQAQYLAAAERAGADARTVHEQVGYGYYSRALPLMRLGRHAEALAAARQSLALHEEVAGQASPAGTAREVGVAMARLRLGEMLALSGAGDAAIAELQRAVDVLLGAMARDGADVSLRLRAMRAELALSRAALAGHGALARTAAEQAVALAAPLPPQVRTGLGGHLVAQARRALAEAALDARLPALARAELAQACPFLQDAQRDGRAGARAALDAASCIYDEALAAAALNSTAEARALVARAVALRRAWSASTPDDAENRVRLAQALRLAATLGAAAATEADAQLAPLAAQGRLAPQWALELQPRAGRSTPTAAPRGASRAATPARTPPRCPDRRRCTWSPARSGRRCAAVRTAP